MDGEAGTDLRRGPVNVETPSVTEPMLDADEARVIGAMIEKSMTTPDHYPMSLNAVMVACNQVSNRDPVVDYAEGFVERTLRRLADRGLAKMVHRPGDRVVKYRHALDEVLGLSTAETALVAVLLLRGEQTPGELRQRTQRYTEFATFGELEATLDGLCHRPDGPPFAERLERRPGQKEYRYRQLLTGGEPAPPRGDEASHEMPVAAADVAGDADVRAEVVALRSEVAELRRRLDAVLGELGISVSDRLPRA